MPLYVLALTDGTLGRWTGGDRRLETVGCAGVHAVCERRTASPPATDEELRAQHALVVAIAQRVPAVLPVRFGSLLQKRELTALIRRHQAEIRAGLDQVRGRVQMTVRVLDSGSGRRPRREPGMTSGRAYLERARRTSALPVPPRAQRLLSALEPYVVSQRRAPGAGELLATIYHLVEQSQVARYTKTAGKPVPGVIVTGPWPPFAFSPQLW